MVRLALTVSHKLGKTLGELREMPREELVLHGQFLRDLAGAETKHVGELLQRLGIAGK